MKNIKFSNINQKEDRFKELLERLNVIAYEFDLALYRYTYVSRQSETILGYECDQWYSKGFWYNHLHPEDRKNASEFRMYNARHNKNHEFEYRMIAADGSVKWFKDITSIISDDGIPETLQGIMLDITEKKISEEKLSETEQRLSSLLNNFHDIVFYESGPEGTFITDNVFDMLGYTPKELSENRGLFLSLIHPNDVVIAEGTFETWRKLEENTFSKIELRLKRKDGRYIWVEDRMFSVKTPYRSYWAGFMVDITDRKQTEEKLKEASTRLSTIINNLSNLTVYETGGGRNYVSENIEKLTGHPISEFLNDSRFFETLIHPADREALHENIKHWHKTGAKGVISTEFRIKNPNGEHIWIEDHMFKVKNDNGKEFLSGIMIDITEKKKAIEKISDTEIRLSTVLSNLPKIVIFQSGKDKDFISENISEMIGYSPEEIFKEKYFFGKIMHEDDLPNVKNMLHHWNTVQKQKDVLKTEYRLKKKDGDYVWIEDHTFKVNPPGAEPYTLGILIDITERKLAEQKITQSLKEKEILLKEIHHRVKNNLQIVSSLLKLQSKSVKDDKENNILQESQNRVHSMALVHQKLYQSKDFANVDFPDYVKQLALNLMDVYKYNGRKVFLNCTSDKIFFGVDIAIPCGLIINELVTNSLKYAFVNRERGNIDIILNNLENGNYKLIVKDDGIGFPKNINFRNTNSLGLQLINTLVKQINGEIDLKNSTGTEFIVTFNDPLH